MPGRETHRERADTCPASFTSTSRPGWTHSRHDLHPIATTAVSHARAARPSSAAQPVACLTAVHLARTSSKSVRRPRITPAYPETWREWSGEAGYVIDLLRRGQCFTGQYIGKCGDEPVKGPAVAWLE